MYPSKILNPVVLVVITGTVACAQDPIQLEPAAANIKHAGHIYYNISTGEKLTTVLGADDLQDAVDGGPLSQELWISTTNAQCADQGFSTEFVFAFDDPADSTTFSNNAILFDWGDVYPDTLVDCVQVHWITDHQDSDTNSDGMADGIEGFAATWTFWDGMNGRGPQLESIALPIIQFRIENLPGEFPADSQHITMYTVDIDLGGNGNAPELMFEIGDTDSELGFADVHNPRMDLRDSDSDGIPDIDPDQDGLADWGWSIQFIQPGTIDLDNADGDDSLFTGIDGDPSDQAIAGVVIGSPTPGHAELDTIGNWNWISDGPTAGATEDSFAMGWSSNPDGSGDLTIGGSFFFGGLSCEADPTFGQYTPAAHFQVILYSGTIHYDCGDYAGNPDGTPDGNLNFLDVSAFLNFFQEGNLVVDLAGNPDGSPDGQLNFIDVSAYLSLFIAGCP